MRPHILVIGDAMLDLHLDVDQVRETDEGRAIRVPRNGRTRLGGAGNAAANAAALGARVTWLTSVGGGARGAEVRRLCLRAGVELEAVIDARPTPVKCRYWLTPTSQRPICRLDLESGDPPRPLTESAALLTLAGILRDDPPAGILISDYRKGLVTASLAEAVREWAFFEQRPTIPVVFDAKPGSLKVIRRIPEAVVKLTARDADAEPGVRELPLTVRIETLGEHGAEICLGPYRHSVETTPLPPDQAWPLGAGDSFAAMLALRLACGDDLREAIRQANAAGRAAAACPRTAIVSAADAAEHLQ